MSNSRPSALFLLHLVQDVAVLRPLITIAARDFDFDTKLLVSSTFLARDVSGVWQQEIIDLCDEAGVQAFPFNGEFEGHKLMSGHGLMFAASESSLPNHAVTHRMFQHAPPGYLKVTVQHGFECVGFRHNADHARVHGASATFAADVLCSWLPVSQLTSILKSQAPKVLVTGPTSVLQMPTAYQDKAHDAPGLICENLHSVRMGASGSARSEFIDTFARFSRALAAKGQTTALRPHPAGQYLLKKSSARFGNVRIENAPIYRLDLRRFGYGISAPSSVLIDMVLAELPTAVWLDSAKTVDAANYHGLPIVSTADEWLAFAQAARTNPKPFRERQRQWLEQRQMPVAPAEVYARFASLFRAVQNLDDQRRTGRREHRFHVSEQE